LNLLRLIGLWAPVLAYMVGIFLLSGQPEPALARLTWDKLLHAGAYALFGLLCLRATHGGFKSLRRPRAVVALILCIGYGAFDEWHQSFVPGRDPSVLDWVADLVGSGLALWIYAGLGRAAR